MRNTCQVICAALLLAAWPASGRAETYGVPPPAPAPAAPVGAQDVRVQRQGSGFSIDAVMHAPVPPEAAWDVLTDFDRMARYQTNLKTSEVLERGADRLLVRQKGVARFGPFSREFESEREMTLAAPRSIRAQQVSGSTLKRMASLMTLEREEGGTRLTYHADIEPETGLPPLVGPTAVRHETAEQFSAMIREMVRRKGVPP